VCVDVCLWLLNDENFQFLLDFNVRYHYNPMFILSVVSLFEEESLSQLFLFKFHIGAGEWSWTGPQMFRKDLKPWWRTGPWPKLTNLFRRLKFQQKLWLRWASLSYFQENHLLFYFAPHACPATLTFADISRGSYSVRITQVQTPRHAITSRYGDSSYGQLPGSTLQLGTCRTPCLFGMTSVLPGTLAHIWYCALKSSINFSLYLIC